jgi:hypothetical protein
MGATKHEKTFADFEKPYEQNLIGLKGIVYFGVGLLLLIIITFGLMHVLLWNVLEADAIATKSSNNPLLMSESDRLPPEPRLQGAPGFQVQGPNGAVNLELREPQSEWRELVKIWDEQRKNGMKHPETGAVIAMPIDEAIDKYVSQPINAVSGTEAEQAAAGSMKYYTDASSGRVAAEKRR